MKLSHFLFRNTSLKQTVAKNTFWIFVSQMGGRLIRAFIVIYGARKVGVVEYGIFSYALSLAALFGLLADLGIDAAMIKESSAEPEKADRYFSTALALKLFLIVMAIGLVFLVGSFLSTLEGARALLPIVIFILVLDNLREFGFAINRAHQKMENEALVNIVTNVGVVVFGVWLINYQANAWYLSLGYAVGTVLGSLLGLYFIWHYVRAIRKNFSFTLAKKLVRIGWPLAFAGILGTLMINTDTLLLGLWKDAAEIGYYSAAQRPVSILYGLIGILAAATFPVVSGLAEKNREKLHAVLTKTINLSFLAVCPLVIGGLLTAKPLIMFVFGSSFAPATLPFQILLLSLFANFATVTLTNVLTAHNKQYKVLLLSVVGLVGNAILDILLIPSWGGAGSAFATLLVQTLIALLLWREATTVVGRSIVPPLQKTLTASACMIVAVVGIMTWQLNILIAIVLGGVTYIGALYYQKEDIFQELRELASR